MNVSHSIPLKEFNRLLCSSSIVIMPLDTEAPAGLIVIFYAAANDKFCMVNETATSCEYITNDRGCILPKDVEIWADTLYYYLSNSEKALEKAKNLHRWIESECSCEKYIHGMNSIYKRILQANVS